MDLTLSEEERHIRRAARELAEEHFSENAFSWQGDVPQRHRDILADHNYMGMTLPEEYGGVDATFFEMMMAIEGIGEVCPETAGLVGKKFGNIQIIEQFAAEQYKQEYLPRVTSGELRTSTVMSEPEAGSAVTDIQTSAEADGDEYVLNGHKIWVSGAHKADVFNTYVRYPSGNIGTLLVDPETPGVEISTPDSNMFGEGQSEIFFDDARVSKDRELVVGADSFKEAMLCYNVNRVIGQAHSWVMAKWLFEEALEYAQTRESGGTPIAEFQGVSHRLADMATKLETTRWLIYRSLSGDELPGRALSCMTKVYGSEKLHEVVDAALQIKGASGYVGTTPESFAYRKLRGYQIASGTSNIHRNNVFNSLAATGYPEL
jgi:alkylation response protein AidB-like acyl-CoA dehydrogenase